MNSLHPNEIINDLKDEGTVRKINRKIDLDKIIIDMFNEIKEIENSKRPQGKKSQAFRRAAEKVTRALYGKRARTKSNAIAQSTASRYLTKIRNSVTATGWMHHALPNTLERLKKKYPSCVHLIEQIENKELSPTRVAVKNLKDKMLQAERLRKAVNAVSLNDTKYATSINQIAKEFPNWKAELQRLKPVKKANRSIKKVEFNEMIDECADLYNHIDQLKIDHEIMRWLKKDAFVIAATINKTDTALSTKKSQTIDIDYPTIMSRCEYLVSPASMQLNDWCALATGIALATGRRAIEVLVQGEFTKISTYKLKFSGQAKERGGIDRENVFEIYSLIEADKVLSAINLLRTHPNISRLIELSTDARHYKFNEIVHNRTSRPLNEFIRKMMKGAKIETGINRDWVFKDTRAIYAAICFKLFFETDKRWAKVDQDMFFQTLLGHSDDKAQAHYKQFKIKRAGEKWESLDTDIKDRLTELEAFNDNELITSSIALKKMHENVKQLITQDPDINVTQRTIKANFGGNYATIRKYVGIVEEALSFDTSLDAILKQEVEVEEKTPAEETPTEEPKPETKPTFSMPEQVGDNKWKVTISHNGKNYDMEIDSEEPMQALQEALSRYELYSTMPKKPQIEAKKEKGWWMVKAIHNDTIIIELAGPGKKSDYLNPLKKEYQKLVDKYQK